MDKEAELAALSAIWARVLVDGERPVNAPPGPVADMLDRARQAFLGDSLALEVLDRARHDRTPESVDALALCLDRHAARDRSLAARLLEFRALLDTGEEDDTQADTVTEPTEFQEEVQDVRPPRPLTPARVTCTATAYWLGFSQFGSTMNTVVGTAGLIAAAAVHDLMTSPSLVIFGVVWLAAGATGFRQLRHQIREITLDGDQVEFSSPMKTFTIPASDITKISWPLWDPQRMAYLRIRTRSHGVIKTAPRMHELRAFRAALRVVNQNVKW